MARFVGMLDSDVLQTGIDIIGMQDLIQLFFYYYKTYILTCQLHESLVVKCIRIMLLVMPSSPVWMHTVSQALVYFVYFVIIDTQTACNQKGQGAQVPLW